MSPTLLLLVFLRSIDSSLARMFKGISSLEDFETEKENFHHICRDIEQRREDMKWLVQQLDQLVEVGRGRVSIGH